MLALRSSGLLAMTAFWVFAGTAFAGPGSADLSIQKTATGFVLPGQSLRYRVSITNHAGSGTDAINVVARDLLPTGTIFNRRQSPGWTLSGAYAIRTLDALAKSFTDTSTLTVDIPFSFHCDHVLHNSVTVTSLTPDPDGSNNSSSWDARIFHCADLSLQKSGAEPIVAGGRATYTLRITNNGPVTARNVMLRDTFPRNLRFDPALNPGWRRRSTNILELSAGSFSAGEARNTILVLGVPDKARCPVAIENRASIQSETPDPVRSNNQHSIRSRLLCRQPPPGRVP